MTHSYAPVEENELDLWLEKYKLVGTILGGFVYGRQELNLLAR